MLAPESMQNPEKMLKATCQSRDQAKEMKSRIINFACTSLFLSGYGIFRTLLHRIRNEDSPLFHQTLFRAHSYLLCVAFFSSIFLLLISSKSSGKRYMGLLTSFVMWVLFNSGLYAVAFALCLLLEVGMVGRILILLSATVPGGLALLLFDDISQPWHAWVSLDPAAKV